MAKRTTRRAKPAPLTRERIVEAAFALIGREGLEAFSMRRLGAELGVEAMSLYHLFPGKQHLVDALLDEALSTVEFAPARLDPRERLRRLMRSYRAMAHRYAPFFPVIAVHRTNTPAGVRFLERVLEIFFEIYAGDEEAARAFRVFGYYLTGASLDETMGYAKGPTAAVPVDGAFIARECPHLARAARFFQRPEWDETFERGMEALLAGVSTPARGRAR